VAQSGCCRYYSVLREMKPRMYAYLAHLMRVPVCLLVATFDPTVERSQNGESDGRSSSVAPFTRATKLAAARGALGRSAQ